MMTFKVRVTQGYRAERSIVIDVDADDSESALESIASGAVEVPDFDDPGWSTGWDLQNEGYEIVWEGR